MTTTETTGKLRPGAAWAYIESVSAAGRVAFPLTDLMQATGLSATAAKLQLRRLGPLTVRVSPSQSFFLIVAPEHRSRGGPPVESWLGDYFRWLGQPYYLALLSAAALHGSRPQSLQVTQVMTAVPRRALEIGRMQVAFFVKRGIEHTPTQELANANAPTRVSTPAATVFDLIRYSGRIGGIGRAIETLRPLLASVGRDDLRAVLDSADEAPTAQRLGYIAEHAGPARLAGWVEQRLSTTPLRVVLLETAPGARRTGTLSERWRVVDNSGEFAR